MKPELIHLPLEKYKQRYTEFLADWELEVLSSDFSVKQLIPASETTVIQKGRVLDSVARPLTCLQQMQMLLPMLSTGKRTVYFSDFYHSGLDALAYSTHGNKNEIKTAAFCWAQTFDRYDFTVDMMEWMRPYEVMALSIYDAVFVAQDLLADLITTALPMMRGKVHAVGLPFKSAHVKSALKAEDVAYQEYDAMYSSRWDVEKNPTAFLDLCEHRQDLRFAICTGSPSLTGTDSKAINRLLKGFDSNRFKNVSLFTDCTKSQYYGVLTRSKVQINTAYQDWVSFTLLEALTFGCKPLYPCYRGFPDALNYSMANMYSPVFDLNEVSYKLDDLIQDKVSSVDGDVILAYHNKTLNRISSILTNL